MSLRHDYRSRPPEQVRVVVFGATGYIGRFVAVSYTHLTLPTILLV